MQAAVKSCKSLHGYAIEDNVSASLYIFLTRINKKHSIVVMQVRVVRTVLYSFQIHFIGLSKTFLWERRMK